MSESVLHLMIHGRVQGVGYRAFVHHEATARGLSGWVRNLRTGEVEMVVRGEATVVEELVDVCRCGPPGARVDRIVRSDTAAPPDGAFTVLPTR